MRGSEAQGATIKRATLREHSERLPLGFFLRVTDLLEADSIDPFGRSSLGRNGAGSDRAFQHSWNQIDMGARQQQELRHMRSRNMIGLVAATIAITPAQAGPAENKRLVASFIHDVFVMKNPQAARNYLSPDYIQHNPNVGPGADGFVRSMTEWLAHAPSDMSDTTLHLIGEGDLVIAHQKVTYTAKDGTKKAAVGFDLFRIRNGRIVEHWDSDG